MRRAVKQDKTVSGSTVKVNADGMNINPVALRIMQLQLPNGQYMMQGSSTSPSACAALTTACQFPSFSYTNPATFHDHQGMGNFDYILSSKHTLSGRYYFEQDPTNGPFASNGTRITASNVLPGFPVFEEKTNQTALLRLTSVLSNSLVNEARVSYQRLIAEGSNSNPYTNTQIGITDLTPGVDNFSEVTISGLSSFGSNTAFGVDNRTNQFEAADQVSWTHGIHSFRTGFEGQRVRNDADTPGSSYMNVSFKSFADFLVGLPACLAGATGPAVTIPHTSQPIRMAFRVTGADQASNVSSIGGTTLANGQYQYQFRVNYLVHSSRTTSSLARDLH